MLIQDHRMNNIKLVAVDIDGVLLKDTFSPVLRNLVEEYGGSYTRDIENNVFSKNQKQAAQYLIEHLSINSSIDSLINKYFQERKKYISDYGGGMIHHAIDMLRNISSTKVKMICYGGLELKYVEDDFKENMAFFDEYICTNNFRPGMIEILNNLQIKPNQSIFIDDVSGVAKTCKNIGCGFIGIPSSNTWGWQHKEMTLIGAKYIFESPNRITKQLLETIDKDVNQCFI